MNIAWKQVYQVETDGLDAFLLRREGQDRPVGAVARWDGELLWIVTLPTDDTSWAPLDGQLFEALDDAKSALESLLSAHERLQLRASSTR